MTHGETVRVERSEYILYKVQPIIDPVRNNCLSINPDTENSIDEHIIAAKTTYKSQQKK